MATVRNVLVEYALATAKPTGNAWVDGQKFTGIGSEVGQLQFGNPVVASTQSVLVAINTLVSFGSAFGSSDAAGIGSAGVISVTVQNPNTFLYSTATWTHATVGG